MELTKEAKERLIRLTRIKKLMELGYSKEEAKEMLQENEQQSDEIKSK